MASTGATRWAAADRRRPGGTIRTASGTGGSIAFTWRGDRANGTRAWPTAAYTAILGVIDGAGNQARRSFTLIRGHDRARRSPRRAPPSFSPDGDGVADTTRLAWTANEPASGTVVIRHGKTVVRSWTVDERPRRWATTWNGRDTKGRRLADGRYELRITLTDAGGNRAWSQGASSSTAPPASSRWSRAFYPQDGDALAADARPCA